jgi:hypothetical protein
MGCWSETCGITGLPITVGNPCVAFLLVRSELHEHQISPSGYCYADDLWSPLELPVFGTYDDYGGLENIREDNNVRRLLDLLNNRASWASVRIEEDSIHGGERKDPVFVDELITVFERAEMTISFRITDYNYDTDPWEKIESDGPPRPVGLMLAHESAYRKAISDAIKNTGSYRQEVDNEIEEVSALQGDIGQLAFVLTSKRDLLGGGADGLAEDMKTDLSLLQEARDFILFRRWIGMTRKFFSPQAGSGSQGTEWGMHASMLRFAADMAHERMVEIIEEMDPRG